MKHNSFFRFYMLFFVVACLFIYGFTQVYKQFFAPPLYHTINIEHVFSAFQTNGDVPEFRILQKDDLQLDQQTLLEFQQQEMIAFTINGQSYYLKSLNEQQYLQWGPVIADEWSESKDSWLVFMFYSILAVVFLAMFRPLFRDVAHLQSCAVEFGKKPSSQPLTINPKSSVYPLAHALYDMSHQLLEQIQIQKDLSNIIAHEVRTPLSRMKFVLQRISADIPEKQLLRLKADIKELEVLAHEYLEFGRSQKTDANYLSDIIIEEFVEHMQDKYVESAIEIKFFNKCQVTALKGNWFQLDLALSNLINNATRYAKHIVQLTVAEQDGHVVFEVEDDGPGFTTTQKQSASGNDHKGFGLGLYIVKQVASRHNGSFVIDEGKLGGASMTVTIPYLAPQTS